MRKYISIAFIAASSLILSQCYYDNEEELYQNFPEENCDVSAVSYQMDIAPMVATNCAYSGCHVNPNAAQGLDLSSYDAIKANASNIKDRINRQDASVMPPGGTLSDCQIEQFTTWIDQGAPNN